MNFIDIHNHILFGLDDGVKTREETIATLKLAEKYNIEKLILTPHFKEGIFENHQETIFLKFNEIKDIIEKNKINIEVYPGSEIFLTKRTTDLLASKKIHTLNNTKYILVETYFESNMMIYDLKEELYNLSVDGYKVILAHPERYEFTHNDIDYIYSLVRDGHLMQVNVTSLRSKSRHHKIVAKLLDHNLVHFIASDAHDLNDRPLKLIDGYEQIKKKYSKQLADDLFYNNPLKVINDEPIKTGDEKKVKTRKWFF